MFSSSYCAACAKSASEGPLSSVSSGTFSDGIVYGTFNATYGTFSKGGNCAL
jgi:hypothetical protein